MEPPGWRTSDAERQSTASLVVKAAVETAASCPAHSYATRCIVAGLLWGVPLHSPKRIVASDT
jgi:hypothetical protein